MRQIMASKGIIKDETCLNEGGGVKDEGKIK